MSFINSKSELLSLNTLLHLFRTSHLQLEKLTFYFIHEFTCVGFVNGISELLKHFLLSNRSLVGFSQLLALSRRFFFCFVQAWYAFLEDELLEMFPLVT